MMLHIIQNTRHHLTPFLGELPDLPAESPAPVGITRPIFAPLPHPSRMVRRMPDENYGKIDEFVPISWI